MAKKRKKQKLPEAAKKHMFKPGQSGNPAGRPPNPIPDALKKLTKQSLRRTIRIIVKGNIDNVKAILKNPKSSALEVLVAASWLKAIERGDYSAAEHIIQRVIGKIPDRLVVESNNVNHNLSGEVNEKKVREALERIEKEI